MPAWPQTSYPTHRQSGLLGNSSYSSEPRHLATASSEPASEPRSRPYSWRREERCPPREAPTDQAKWVRRPWESESARRLIGHSCAESAGSIRRPRYMTNSPLVAVMLTSTLFKTHSHVRGSLLCSYSQLCLCAPTRRSVQGRSLVPFAAYSSPAILTKDRLENATTLPASTNSSRVIV